MTKKGLTGSLYGIEVKARQHVERPKVTIKTTSPASRDAILRAAERIYEQHHEVIQALAKR